MRFPIVQSIADLDAENFKDPGEPMTAKILGTVSIVNDELAAKITQEAKAGRSVYLQAKTVDRQDGTFIVAAVITTAPAGSVASMPKLVANNPVESGSTADQIVSGLNLGTVPGSGEGSGTGSGSGGGSGSGPDAV